MLFSWNVLYFLCHFQIYGIDAASGAAVSALNISAGDQVLDLCAAPGKQSSILILLRYSHQLFAN